MKSIKQIIANNLVELRKSHKMTQLELAEKLNYTDKAVSRWEQGIALPDIDVLCQIADIYGVSFEYLISDAPHKEKRKYLSQAQKRNKFAITLLAMSTVWLIATVIFVCAKILIDDYLWIVYVWAVPASALIALIFNSIWGNRRMNYLIISVMGWSIFASIYLQFISDNFWAIFLLGVPMQIAIFFWSRINKRHSNSS